MKFTVIGGTGLIGSQVVQKLTAAGHEAIPAAPSTGVDLITGEGPGPGAGRRRGRGQPDELADIRRGVPGLLPHLHGQPAGRGRARRCPAPGDPLDRRRGPGAPAGLLPGQDPAGGPAPPGAHAVLHRARHPVLRVHGHASCPGPPTTPPSACPPPASSRSPPRTSSTRSSRSATGAPLQGIRNVAGPDVFPLDELGRVTLAARHDDRTRHHRRPGRHVRGRHRRRAHRRPGAHTWHRRTTRTGSRRPGNRGSAYRSESSGTSWLNALPTSEPW